jgi:hypothetical protein
MISIAKPGERLLDGSEVPCKFIAATLGIVTESQRATGAPLTDYHDSSGPICMNQNPTMWTAMWLAEVEPVLP